MFDTVLTAGYIIFHQTRVHKFQKAEDAFWQGARGWASTRVCVSQTWRSGAMDSSFRTTSSTKDGSSKSWSVEWCGFGVNLGSAFSPSASTLASARYRRSRSSGDMASRKASCSSSWWGGACSNQQVSTYAGRQQGADGKATDDVRVECAGIPALTHPAFRLLSRQPGRCNDWGGPHIHGTKLSHHGPVACRG
jgi:hypothetical protein